MTKTCLITGATSGIGKAALLELARKDYRLYFVGRDKERSLRTEQEILSLNSNVPVKFFLCDLSSRKEVLSLASKVKEELNQIDVLVNNAGAIFMNNEKSEDGIEMTMALNHFGYFWLTNELIDLLKVSPQGRIVNVSSRAHVRVRTKDAESIFDTTDFLGYFTYGKSKLANLLFTFELARRLKDSSITVNAMHPGLVATRFASNNGVIGYPFKLLTGMLGMSAEEGARTIVYLADSPSVDNVTGKYFVRDQIVEPSSTAKNEELAAEFWRLSERKTSEIASLSK